MTARAVRAPAVTLSEVARLVGIQTALGVASALATDVPKGFLAATLLGPILWRLDVDRREVAVMSRWRVLAGALVAGGVVIVVIAFGTGLLRAEGAWIFYALVSAVLVLPRAGAEIPEPPPPRAADGKPLPRPKGGSLPVPSTDPFSPIMGPWWTPGPPEPPRTEVMLDVSEVYEDDRDDRDDRDGDDDDDDDGGGR